MAFVVAIDGPAGSGKGTLAKLISEKYGLVNVDTGAMYRCLTLYLVRKVLQLKKLIRLKLNYLISTLELKEEMESNIFI